MAKSKAAGRRTLIVGAIIGIHVVFFIGLTAGLNRDVIMDQWVKMDADMEEVKDDTPPPPPPPPPADFEPPPLEMPPAPDLPQLVDAPAAASAISIPSAPVRVREEPVQLPPLVAPTKAINYFRKNKPPYPSASRRLQEEGSVVTQIVVATDGTVSCSVADGSGMARLDEAVVRWCATKKFDPATRAGNPETFSFKLKYTFRLEDE